MTNLRYESVWKILKDNNFEIINENNASFQCTICKKILINASNGPCGCRYCLECITDYLQNEEKCCPGNSEECKYEVLKIEKNILIDQTANKLISKIKVKCPDKLCDHIDELCKIDDHLRLCSCKQRMICPFFSIGCSENKFINDDEVDNHLLKESQQHATLQMEWLQNRHNEIEVNKRDFEKKMKEEILEVQFHQNDEIFSLKELVEEFRQEIIQLKLEIDQLKKKSEEKERSIVQLQMRDNEKITMISDLKKEFQHLQSIKEKSGLAIIESKVLSKFVKKIDAEVDNLKCKLNDVETNLSFVNYGDFVWKISDFSEKRKKSEYGIDTEIHSNPFYSHKNGYKMCLCVYPDGGGVGEGTHLSLGFSIMRGEFDELLPWPMKHEVTFSIIDQESGTVYRSATGNYFSTPIENRCVFDRPFAEKNMCLSRPRFVTLHELWIDPGLVNNDTVVLKCWVHPIESQMS